MKGLRGTAMKVGAILAFGLVVACVTMVGTLGVSSLHAEPQHVAGLPDLGVMAGDSLTMRVHGVGGTFSVPEEPVLIQSTEDGRVEATFVEVRYAPAVDFVFYWDGEEIGSILAPEVTSYRWRYTLEVYIAADGSPPEVLVETPEAMYTWCGLDLGYCRPGEAAAYSTPECTAASHDPEYLKLYKPGSGPACIHRHYVKKCADCPYEIVK